MDHAKEFSSADRGVSGCFGNWACGLATCPLEGNAGDAVEDGLEQTVSDVRMEAVAVDEDGEDDRENSM